MANFVTKTTPNITQEQLDKLKAIFPECISEGKIDFNLLKATLGKINALSSDNAYSFSWAGKESAFKAIQTPSAASLEPVQEESINWENSQNLFIEGENLEVLKLLYKSYFGKIKMIYIDPPYNTGNDFIYKDDYSQPLRTYLEKTGQMDAEGNLLTSNPETGGRYHSDWLTMMYPRLFLARQLLRDDGVIFVSIDDHEFHHLRMLMNEIFGEENFVTTIIWQKVFSPKNSAKYFSEDHEYIITFAKNKEGWRPNLLPRSEEADSRYSNLDNDPRGPWSSSDLTARNYYSEGQYDVRSPKGKTFRPSIGTYWRVNEEKFHELNEDNRIWWGEGKNNMPRLKRFLSEVKQGIVPQTLWFYEDVGHTQEAKKELLQYVDFENTENVFNTLKPPRLIRKLLKIGTNSTGGEIVLDFFGGSASTAQAVLDENVDDQGDRRFIIVQFPEPLVKPESKLTTIADIAKMRIRNVLRKRKKLSGSDEFNLGFRVFKLSSSTFRQWELTKNQNIDYLEKQLTFFDSGLKDNVNTNHVIYEIILKEGFDLTSVVTELDIETNRVIMIVQPNDSEKFLYICLDREIHPQTIDQLFLDKQTKFICLDSALEDSIKVNLSMMCLLKTI